MILIIFLDFKSAIFTSLGMLIVISVSLIYMTYSGITFNIISLGGIITVLGMIVDNSIVVSENIFKIGVILGFAVHRMPMSFVGAVGIVGLAGVVVNNGIIMVDLINRILEQGNIHTREDVLNAVVEGTGDRFRAIFLTTVTTIFGLLPTVYGIGGHADLIVPMVMAMAYGLLFAALLTLIFLPCLFMISADLKLIKINYQK